MRIHFFTALYFLFLSTPGSKKQKDHFFTPLFFNARTMQAPWHRASTSSSRKAWAVPRLVPADRSLPVCWPAATSAAATAVPTAPASCYIVLHTALPSGWIASGSCPMA